MCVCVCVCFFYFWAEASVTWLLELAGLRTLMLPYVVVLRIVVYTKLHRRVVLLSTYCRAGGFLSIISDANGKVKVAID